MKYQLRIEELREFEGGHLGYYTKGHFDTLMFAETLNLLFNSFVKTERVRHEWWRVVPVGEKGAGFIFHISKPGKQGSFPVTVVED